MPESFIFRIGAQQGLRPHSIPRTFSLKFSTFNPFPFLSPISLSIKKHFCGQFTNKMLSNFICQTKIKAHQNEPFFVEETKTNDCVAFGPT
jgi:hypothetical protein